MAVPSLLLVEALRQTAVRLQRPEVTYRWSHVAHCNCGHLAQTLTGLSPTFIRDSARRHAGDWAQQALAHSGNTSSGATPGNAPDEGAWEPEDVGACNVTGHSMSQIFSQMLAHGLTQQDIAHLERLEAPGVRRRMGNSTVDVAHGDRQVVIEYLLTWATILEEQLHGPASTLAEPSGELPLAEAAE